MEKEDIEIVYKKLKKYAKFRGLGIPLFTSTLRTIILKIKGKQIARTAPKIAKEIYPMPSIEETIYESKKFVEEEKDKKWFKDLVKKYKNYEEKPNELKEFFKEL